MDLRIYRYILKVQIMQNVMTPWTQRSPSIIKRSFAMHFKPLSSKYGKMKLVTFFSGFLWLFPVEE